MFNTKPILTCFWLSESLVLSAVSPDVETAWEINVTNIYHVTNFKLINKTF